MVIEVDSNAPCVMVDGFRIEAAPPLLDLIRRIGTPDRVDTGPVPAPYGFRNNHRHVFDSLGIYIGDHHHTGRATELGLTLQAEDLPHSFLAKRTFAGTLLFDRKMMPLHATEREFFEASPWPFERFFGGKSSIKFAGFFVGIDAIGRKLPSGRRSKNRVVATVSLSWPHDPHSHPTSD